jgi:hypothetical protein
MSMHAAALTRTAPRADESRDPSYRWTVVLVLGVILTCSIGAGLYFDAPVLDASLVGP